MTEREPRSDDFDERLSVARERQRLGRGRASGMVRGVGGYSVGFRIAIELLAGVVVGVGLGFFADRWLGTSPWLMLLGIVLGTAAGIVNVLRAVKSMERTRRAVEAEERTNRTAQSARNGTNAGNEENEPWQAP
jgi:ATP synthase protein I